MEAVFLDVLEQIQYLIGAGDEAHRTPTRRS
ncbi:MAG: hypothetical protein KatS3mg108_0698 [Isosphaeraceae bacterium]|jgi:hypothetical protein|nr:MAG: hypothetical protein KatS3mg108_0698 [Isosphaeraceae bacterium]